MDRKPLSQSSAPSPSSAVENRRCRSSDGGEIVSLTLALAVICLAAKIALLPFPVTTFGEFLRWMLRLAIVVSPDICFVAGLGAIGVSIASAARRFPAARRFLRPAWILIFLLAALYAAASVPIYRWTMVPLTLPSLWLAGGRSMASSVSACVGIGTLLVVATVPLLMIVVATLSHAVRWRGNDVRLNTRWAVLTLSVIVAYGFLCRTYVHAHWSDPNRWERRIAQNPHMVFVASCLAELFRGDLSEMFDDPDESDFLPKRAHSNVRQVIERIPESDRPKNVILIVLESTGVEYLSLYGSRHDTTPNLNRLAQERGVVFENMYVQTPSSCKSLAALTASVYPRADWWLLVRDQPDFNVPTIAEVLAERGYRTCFAHSGYWSWKNRDRFLRRRGGQKLIDAASLPAKQVNSWGVSDRAMFQATLDWIEESREPFFLFAYTIETHHPYVARPPQRDFGVADPDLNRYLNAIRATDETLGWFMSELRRRGLDRSTLVAITADHGESFGQHNQRIHSFAVYESAVHVPLVVLHPSMSAVPADARSTGAWGRAARNEQRAPSLRRWENVCQHIDIAPTLLTLLDIEPPAAWQGRCLLTPRDPSRAYFFATGNEIILGLRDGQYKYHYYLDSGHHELFDLANDPAEANNLAPHHQARCTRYQRKLGGFIRHQRRCQTEIAGAVDRQANQVER